MDINMSNATFVKGTDNWIYLITDGSTKLGENNGIKVFYDDDTIKTSNSMAEVYQEYMKQVNAENSTTTLNSMWSVIDFMMTYATSSPKDLAKLEPKNWLESINIFQSSEKATEFGEKLLIWGSAAFIQGDDEGEHDKKCVQELLGLTVCNVIKSFELYGKKKSGGSVKADIIGLFPAVFLPSYYAALKKFGCSDVVDLARGVKTKKTYIDPNSNNKDLKVTVSGSEILEYIARESVLNYLSAQIMGDIMILGKTLIAFPDFRVRAIGCLLCVAAKVVSGAIKDFISKKYNGIQDMISNFSLEKIIESKDSFSVFFNALSSNTTNFLKDIKNMMMGVPYNVIQWKMNGVENCFTKFEIDSPNIVELFKLEGMDGIKNILTNVFEGKNIEFGKSQIKAVLGIYAPIHSGIKLINNSIEDPNIAPIRVFLSSNITADDVEKKIDYFVLSHEQDIRKIRCYTSGKKNIIDYIGVATNNIIGVSDIIDKLNFKVIQGPEDSYLDTGKNMFLQQTVLNKKAIEKVFKGREGLNGFTVEQILEYNKKNNLKDVIKPDVINKNYILVDDDFWAEELFNLLSPLDGRVSGTDKVTDKVIYGDLNIKTVERDTSSSSYAPNTPTSNGESIATNSSINLLNKKIEEYNKAGQNIFTGDGKKNIVYGGLGSDTITGGVGVDYIYGGESTTKYTWDTSTYKAFIAKYGKQKALEYYYNGNFNFFEKTTIEDTDKERDVIDGGAGNDILVGGAGEDTISGGTGNNLLLGGKANFDKLLNESVKYLNNLELIKKDNEDNAKDILIGGENNDIIYVSNKDEAYGFDGRDTINVLGNYSEKIEGGNGNDTFYVYGKFNVINGGGDNDTYKSKTNLYNTYIDKSGKNTYDIKVGRIIDHYNEASTILNVSGEYRRDKQDVGLYRSKNGIYFKKAPKGSDLRGLIVSKDYYIEIKGDLGIKTVEKDADAVWEKPKYTYDEVFSYWKEALKDQRKDPLVFNFGNEEIVFSSVENGVHFDLDGSGTAEKVAWTNSNAGFLSLDRNEDGVINDGTELFGDSNILSNGFTSVNGFQTLEDFDENRDGVIDSKDSIFEKLKVWKDINYNGYSEKSEIFSIKELGVKSISLETKDINFVSKEGNVTDKKSTITMNDGTTKELVEYFLKNNSFDTESNISGNKEVYNEALRNLENIDDYPDIKGTGNVNDLKYEISFNENLRKLIDEYMSGNTSDELLDKIIIEWSHHKDETGIIGSFVGQEYISSNGNKIPTDQAKGWINHAYVTLKREIANLLFIQSKGQTIFSLLGSGVAEKEVYKNIIKNDYYNSLITLSIISDEINNFSDTFKNSFNAIKSIVNEDSKLQSDFYKIGVNDLSNNMHKDIIYNSGEYCYSNNDGDDVYIYHGQYIEVRDTVGKNTIKVVESSINKENLIFKYTVEGVHVLLQGDRDESKEIFRFIDLNSLKSIELFDETIITAEEIVEKIKTDIEATAYDDRIEYAFSSLKISMLRGNDIVHSGNFDDKISGDRGNDTIITEGGNDILEGGLDNDILEGGKGDDTYIFNFGDGNDVINDSEGNNVISFGEGLSKKDLRLSSSTGKNINITFQGLEEGILIKNWNSNFSLQFFNGEILTFEDVQNILVNSLNITNGDDTINYQITSVNISSLDGNDIINTGEYDDVINGGSGNDTISSSGGNDILEGGKGNDILYGGQGNDTYIYNLGDGQDIISDSNGINVVKFGTNITKDNLYIYIDSNENINIEINGSQGDKLTISKGSSISKLEFFDKSFLDYGDIIESIAKNISSLATEGNDRIIFNKKELNINSLGGNDYIISGVFNDKINGGAGNDTIYSSSGDDVLEGGIGDDILYGELGDDTYIFNIGDGQDIISDTQGINKIKFGAGIIFNNLIINEIDNKIVIEIKGTNDKIKVDTLTNCKFIFEDGSEYNYSEILKKTMELINVTEGNDNIKFTTAPLNINALSGDDYIISGAYNDTLQGGAGNDVLEGGAGNDTYIFNLGDGHDIIKDWSGENAIKFGANITKEDLLFITDNNGNFKILFKNLKDSITLSTLKGISKIYFNDGIVMDYTAIFTKQKEDISKIATNSADIINFSLDKLEINGLDGNDTIISGNFNDILEGGKGNDILIGNEGNDTYIFNLGDGQDTITDNSGANIIKFGKGISRKDLLIYVNKNGEHEIVVKDTLDKITVSSIKNIDKIVFEDGSEISNTIILKIIEENISSLVTEESDNIRFSLTKVNIDLLSGDDVIETGSFDDVIKGNKGNDTISSLGGNDILEGGEGNDKLYGGEGNDTYIFNLEDGQDIIEDNSGFDLVKFGEGITLESLKFLTSNNGIKISIKGTEDSIMISRFNTNLSIQVENKILNFDELCIEIANRFDVTEEADNINFTLGKLVIDTKAGDDIIVSGKFNDTITGGKGNDYIKSGAGSDTYYYNLGDGNDIIEDNEGFNTLRFGENITKEMLDFNYINNNLMVKVSENDTITFTKFNDFLKIFFFDGSSIDYDYIMGKVTEKFNITDDRNVIDFKINNLNIDMLGGDDLVISGEYSDNIKGNAGNDEIHSNGGDDILFGGEGNDKLSGGAGDDVLEGGKDNDILEGGEGNDTYIFNLGDGIDTIKDNLGFNIIQFGEGITKEDILILSTNKNNFEIKIKGSEDKIVLENFKTINRIIFNTGEKLEYSEILSKHLEDRVNAISDSDDIIDLTLSAGKIDAKAGNDIIYGGKYEDVIFGNIGSDIIYGNAGNDILEGGVGNDTLYGGEGNDIYIFNLGDGQDKISDNQGINVIKFGENIAKGDISVIVSEGKIQLVINQTLDTITIDINTQISKVIFADKSVWNYEEILKDAKEYVSKLGTEEADKIEYTLDSIIVNSLGGDDTVISGNYNDKLSGGQGNDKLVSSGGNDILEGGEGNDTLEGGDGNDVYLYNLGDGIDTISDTSGTDTIKFGDMISKDDIYLRRENDNLIICIHENGKTYEELENKIILKDWYKNSSKIEVLDFSNGTKYQISDFVTTIHDDVIVGGYGNDILMGGRGNDTLLGGYGDDIYIYNKGDGQDIIYDHYDLYVNEDNRLYAGNDTLKFGEGLTKEDILIKLEGSDLIVGIKEEGKSFEELRDKITLKYFSKSNLRIENFEFGDGTKLNLDNILNMLLSNEDDVLTWNDTKLNINSLAGNDIITAGNYNNIISAGAGDDKITTGAGNDEVHGGVGNDILRGEGGDDILEGGEGNDTLEGGDGNDIYLYNLGDGQDIIYDNLCNNNSYYSGNDTLKFGEGISKEDLILTKEENNLIINFKNQGGNNELMDKLTLSEWYIKNKRIETIEFFDGTKLGVQEIFDMFTTEGNDILYLGQGNYTLNGGKGNDILYACEQNSYDYIHDWRGNIHVYNTNTLNGGQGDDILYGGDKTIYLFNKGDGKDTIIQSNNYIDTRKLKFGDGINKDDLILKKNGDDLLIVIKEEGKEFEELSDSITIKNWYLPGGAIYLDFGFQDGSWLDSADIMTLFGTNEDDIIYGHLGRNKLYGGKGNDTLIGNSNVDVYIYNKGDGQDTIVESGTSYDNDTLRFGEGISKEDLVLKKNGDDLIIGIKEEGKEFEELSDSITIKNWYSYWNGNCTYRIENFEFYNKNNLDSASVMSLFATEKDDTVYGTDGIDILVGGKGNDTLYGNKGNDTLYGNEGNDTLIGGYGNDIYIYNKGDGQDTIYESARWGVDNDTLRFGEGITKEDLIFYQKENTMIVGIKEKDKSFEELEDKIIFKDWGHTSIQNFEFSDKSKLNINDLLKLFINSEDNDYSWFNYGVNISFGEGDDVVHTGDYDDVINGDEGNDTIDGGYGNDTLIGGQGNDTLIGGVGEDIYIYNRGDGQDTIYESARWGVDNDTLRFGEGISKEDILMKQVGSDVIVALKEEGKSFEELNDKITLKNWGNNNERIESFEFSDGTKIGVQDIIKLFGTSENDTFTWWESVLNASFGTGDDVIQTGIYDDVINGGAGNDTIDGGYGNNIIYGDEGNDIITTGSGNDTLSGGIGDDELSGHDGNDNLYGNEGNDTLYGGSGNDIIIGGKGNDTLYGGGGDDIFIYNKGDGQDIIDGDEGNDILKFGEGISLEDILIKQVGTNEVVALKEEGKTFEELSDKITLKDWNNSAMAVEYFEFVDGTRLGVQEILQLFGTAGNDTFTWNGRLLDISFGDGDDVIHTGYYDDVINGGAGNDIIDGSSGNNTIYGDNGNDIITTGTGNDIISGGNGNDILSGGNGNDIYIYNRGDGQDVIKDNSGEDILRFGEGISKEDILVKQVGSDLILALKEEGKSFEELNDKITLKNWYNKNERIENFEFLDGIKLGVQDIIKLFGTSENDTFTWTESLLEASFGDGDDVIHTGYYDDVINGGTGNDVIDGGSGNNIVHGNEGNDIITTDSGNDTLSGGQGNDTLSGGQGNDVYIYNLGDGQDVIIEKEGSDILKFGEGISKENLIFKQNGKDLEIGIKEGNKSFEELNDKIIIKEFNWNSSSQIEKFEFSDGNSYFIGDLAKLFTTSGNDTIRFYGRIPELSLGSGDDNIEAGMYDDIIHGDEGNDTINTDLGNDVLDGGRGNDILYGDMGDDTYIYNLGDGIDIINDNHRNAQNGGIDTLNFGINITKESLILKRDENNLIIGLKEAGKTFEELSGKITIINWYNIENRIEYFKFSNDVILEIKDILEAFTTSEDDLFTWTETAVKMGFGQGDDTINTGSFDDMIHGEAGNDTINTGAGNDELYGDEGNDILNAGQGNDILYGGKGNDQLNGGLGDDIYVFNKGDGQDIINDEYKLYDWWTQNGGNDTLKFGIGITKDNLVLRTEGNNIIIALKEEGKRFDELNDKVTLTNWYDENTRIEKFEFSDGEVLEMKDMINLFISSGDDSITWRDNLLDIFLGTGDDVLISGSYDDKIYGEAGNDIISTGAGNDILVGGQGDDELYGEAEDDIYIYNLGDGKDIIEDWDGNDTIKFGEGITKDDLILRQDEFDLIIGIKAGNETFEELKNKITIRNGNYRNIIENFEFFDGSKETIKDLLKQLITSGNDIFNWYAEPVEEYFGSGDDIITTGEFDDILYGEDGNDIIDSGKGNDILYGGKGNDILYGDSPKINPYANGDGDYSEGHDLLVGGEGNDTLYGGLGHDTYLFNKGDGQDIIIDEYKEIGVQYNEEGIPSEETEFYYNAGVDTLKFGEGITKDDLVLKQDGNDLIVGIKEENKSFDELSDKITLKNWTDENKSIENFEFSDGTVIDIKIFMFINKNGQGEKGLILYGGEGNDDLRGGLGNDMLYGQYGDDILYGGKGNDILYGDEGDDIYLFNKGDGNDYIVENFTPRLVDNNEPVFYESIGIDTLKFGEGILKDDLVLKQDGNDLIVGIKEENKSFNELNDKIGLKNWLTQDKKVEHFEFSDGTILTENEIAEMAGILIQSISSFKTQEEQLNFNNNQLNFEDKQNIVILSNN